MGVRTGVACKSIATPEILYFSHPKGDIEFENKRIFLLKIV